MLSKIILGFIFTIGLAVEVYSQENIPYGSNDGTYVNMLETKIYYEEYGTGVPLFLLHGGFGSIGNFKDLIPKLSEYYRVILLDRPGHGRSEHADSLSYELMAKYHSKFLDLLDIDSAYLIGRSDGGCTSFLLAYLRPDVIKKMVVIGSNSNRNAWTNEGSSSITPEIVENEWGGWLKDYQSKSPQPELWEKFIIDTDKMFKEEVIISKDELGDIHTPTLIVQGDRDPFIKLEHSLELHGSILNSELCIIPGSGLNPVMEKPNIVIELMMDFLRK
ncbi:MAG: alpha/beta hydrolase [Cyclobacteriaceae bacterium]